MRLTYDERFAGWWILQSHERDERFCNRVSIRQIRGGEDRDIMLHRGPFPTREVAESFQYRDCLESYWEAGLDVYADHCLKCGLYAKVLAFDNQGCWAWRVTECKRCGIIDSRACGGMADASG